MARLQTKDQAQSRITPEIAQQIITAMRSVAKAEVLPRYRRLESDAIEAKTSFSDLVTIADKCAEQSLTARMADILPGFSVLGEEAVAADPSKMKLLQDSEAVIIIDPVDGTWNYAKGLPLFGMIIAVVEDGRTTFGALYDPVSDDWIVARTGQGAFYGACDGRQSRVQVRPETSFTRMTGFVPLFLLPKAKQVQIAGELPDFDRILSLRCSCHEYRLLSEGSVTFGLSGLLKPWDHAAGELIYREAGGHAALLSDGGSYSPASSEGQLLLAPDPATWNRLREKFHCLL